MKVEYDGQVSQISHSKMLLVRPSGQRYTLVRTSTYKCIQVKIRVQLRAKSSLDLKAVLNTEYSKDNQTQT